jgi:hypothetical protein
MILRNSLLAIAILLTPLEGLARALPPSGPDQTGRHFLNAAVPDQKPQSTGTAAELQAKVVDFVRENGKLMAQFAGGAKAEALPESTLKFRIKAFEIGVTFSGLEKGRFSEITLEPRGQILHGKRAEPPDLVPAQLREYAGNYYSDELGTTYTVVVQDGKLVAQHRRHDDITLTPLDQDTFLGSQWFFQRVRFTRDKEGHVTGMRVTGGRVRNMRFDRHP